MNARSKDKNLALMPFGSSADLGPCKAGDTLVVENLNRYLVMRCSRQQHQEWQQQHPSHPRLEAPGRRHVLMQDLCSGLKVDRQLDRQ